MTINKLNRFQSMMQNAMIPHSLKKKKKSAVTFHDQLMSPSSCALTPLPNLWNVFPRYVTST